MSYSLAAWEKDRRCYWRNERFVRELRSAIRANKNQFGTNNPRGYQILSKQTITNSAGKTVLVVDVKPNAGPTSAIRRVKMPPVPPKTIKHEFSSAKLPPVKKQNIKSSLQTPTVDAMFMKSTKRYFTRSERQKLFEG